MLSINQIEVEQAVNYYKVVAEPSLPQVSPKERYYTQKAGLWFGQGAKMLKLQGKSVEPVTFQNILAGWSPKGTRQLVQEGVEREGQVKKRAGWDYTFSASKSVSLTAEILAPHLKDEIYKAHNRAVRQALSYFEKNYTQARITIKHDTQTIKTGNLASALFLENTSRELDPQIHTHCVIANITKRPDGQWRALRATELFKQKMFIGQIYRNELAQDLQQLGFSIDQRAKGLFEISGLPENLIEKFSVRSEQIEDYIKQNNLRALYPAAQDSVLKGIAAVRSREAKQVDVTEHDLKTHWAAKLKQAGYKGKEQELLEGMLNRPALKFERLNHVDQAMKVLTEEESLLTREAILETALKLSLGQKTIRDIAAEFSTSKLIRKRNGLYTTEEIERIEKQIKDLAIKGRNIHQPLRISLIDKALNQFENLPFTDSQKKAFVHGLKNTDYISGIQGDAGTGKTSMLKKLAQEFQKAGLEVVPLSPTTAAVEELKNKEFADAQTIDRFLLADKPSTQPRLIIIDEASFLGSKKFYRLLQKTNPRQDRILMIGDVKQQGSIEAGGIFGALQRNDLIKTTRMDKNIRQKEQFLYKAVNHLANKEVESAFQVLDENKRINEIANRDERLRTAANKYVKSFQKNDTVLIVQTNTDRRQVNKLIRETLIEQKLIDKHHSLIVTTQQPKNTQQSNKNLPFAYEAGDTFFVSENFNGLRAGDRGLIEQVDHHKKSIRCRLVTNGRVKRTSLDIGKYGHLINAYRQEDREIARGDKIVFLKPDRMLDISNGTTGTVLDVRHGNLRVLTNQKKIVKFNADRYNYFDYSYSSTTFKAQGLTCEKVVYLADTRGRINLNNFYVAASRATSDIEILTDDKETLRELVQVEQTKTSTLDLARNPDMMAPGLGFEHSLQME